MVNFIRKATKKSLLALLKRGDKMTRSDWERLFEGVLFKDEYETFSAAGGIDHGSLGGLADDDHTRYLDKDGTRALTGDWDAGAFEIRAETLESDVATGTAPLTIASVTLVSNLNSDLLDGQEGTYYLDADNHSYTVTTQTTATLTLDATHNTVLCDGTSNTVTVTLPTAVGITGKIYNIKAINVDNAVELAADGTEEVDGSTTNISFALMETVTVQSDNANWWII